MDECPRCGRPGFAYAKFVRCGRKNCRCAGGQLHGPYPVVEHYQGFDPKRGKKRIVRTCYISAKRLEPKGRNRITELLRKYRHQTSTNYK